MQFIKLAFKAVNPILVIVLHRQTDRQTDKVVLL
jgi:hypothetical protein